MNYHITDTCKETSNTLYSKIPHTADKPFHAILNIFTLTERFNLY